MEPVRRGALPDGLYGAELEHRIDEAAEVIRARLEGEPELATPRLAFVLGSGLGGVVDLLEPAHQTLSHQWKVVLWRLT